MSRPGYSLFFGLIVVFVALRLLIGDWIGAFWSLAVLVLVSALVLAIVIYFASNAPAWWRRLRGISWEAHLKQLEREGKALREHYQAKRVVTFEDENTGCLVHLLDVGDGRLLCLYGQSYYSFEPTEDDPDVNQPRKFPTKNFSLLRRKNNGEVLELAPGADVLEPTFCGGVARPQKIYDLGVRFEDGKLVPNVSFEAVEEACRSLGTRGRAA
jgi:hypothetical protein